MIEDIKPPQWWYRNKELEAKRRAIRKLIKNFKTMGGVIGDRAVLIMYNETRPEETYVLTEKII